jgi:hypothetical protein
MLILPYGTTKLPPPLTQLTARRRFFAVDAVFLLSLGQAEALPILANRGGGLWKPIPKTAKQVRPSLLYPCI